MATSSFDKTFAVNNPNEVEALKQALLQPKPIPIKQRNYTDDNKKGVELLKRRLSNLSN